MKTCVSGLLLAAGLLTTGCAPARDGDTHADRAAPATAGTKAGAAAEAAPAAAPLPRVLMHKNAGCGCCSVWAEHMRAAGFEVEERVDEDMEAVKRRVGLPYAMGSCHTAEVGGYFVEGHVPAQDVLRLLAERPDARGVTVPGMPVGSPGMEHPDDIVQPYAVLLIDRDGEASEYARHGAAE